MTKIEALDKSLEMWEWLSKNSNPALGCTEKEVYLTEVMKIEFEDLPVNNCFLCEYCYDYAKDEVSCDKCPVQWGTVKQEKPEVIYCQFKNSCYDDWRRAGSKELKCKYAGKVADLIRTTLEQEKKK